MVKKQMLLYGVVFIFWGMLILLVLVVDNLYFFGSLVVSLCILIMQGVDIVEVDFLLFDVFDFIFGGQFVCKFLVFEFMDCDLVLSNGVQVIFIGIEVIGMCGILVIDSYLGVFGIGIGIEMLFGVFVGINNESGVVFMLVMGKNMLSLNVWV